MPSSAVNPAMSTGRPVRYSSWTVQRPVVRSSSSFCAIDAPIPGTSRRPLAPRSRYTSASGRSCASMACAAFSYARGLNCTPSISRSAARSRNTRAKRPFSIVAESDRALPPEELQEPAVHQLGLLLLHPVSRVGDVAYLEGAAHERLHADRQLFAQRDVLLAPDEERGGGDFGPVGERQARRGERAVGLEGGGARGGLDSGVGGVPAVGVCMALG